MDTRDLTQAYWLLRQWRNRVVADRHAVRALYVLQLERAISAIGRKIWDTPLDKMA